MQIVKGIVIGIYFIVCLALVILAMVQSKDCLLYTSDAADD